MKTLLRRLPNPIYRALKRLYQRIRPSALAVAPANPGPLVTRIAPRLAQIPGWFNLDDIAHFTLVLETQASSGITGDLLEIGCYHGRSAALLAMHLQAQEHLILVDAFDLALAELYGDTPSPKGVRQNLQTAVPNLSIERVRIIRAYSKDLELPMNSRVRFAHVDGGHDRDTLLADLENCTRALIAGGVIVVDDFAHARYPGVTQGVKEFLARHTDLRVMADLNRAGAIGRKLYLSKT